MLLPCALPKQYTKKQTAVAVCFRSPHLFFTRKDPANGDTITRT